MMIVSKTHPNQPSKSELIRLSISEKKGIISAIMNAAIQVRPTMPAHVLQAMRELE